MYRSRSHRTVNGNNELRDYVDEILRNLQEFHGNYSAHIAFNRGNICGNGVLVSHARLRINQIFDEIQMHNRNRILRGLEPHQLSIAITTNAEWLVYQTVKPTWAPDFESVDERYAEFYSSNSATVKPTNAKKKK